MRERNLLLSLEAIQEKQRWHGMKPLGRKGMGEVLRFLEESGRKLIDTYIR